MKNYKTREKGSIFNDKHANFQEGIAIINRFAPHIEASKDISIMKWPEEGGCNTILTAGDFNSLLSTMDRKSLRNDWTWVIP